MLAQNSSDLSQVGSKLKEKGALLPCPRCGQPKFQIVGESQIILTSPSTPLNMLTLPSITDIPSYVQVVIIGCENCGYLIQHAKGPLGL